MPLEKTAKPARNSSGQSAAQPSNRATAQPAKAGAPVTYADAGVDITSGDRTKQRIKYLAQKTFNRNVLSEIGGFGGLFKLDTAKYTEPVLVSSADCRSRTRAMVN